jgi:hypothetical protein
LLDFDLARQPVRPHELAALVEAIENAHPSDEQDWLEWKSMLDLGSKAHLAAIAKCILALANRDPGYDPPAAPALPATQGRKGNRVNASGGKLPRGGKRRTS